MQLYRFAKQNIEIAKQLYRRTQCAYSFYHNKKPIAIFGNKKTQLFIEKKPILW